MAAKMEDKQGEVGESVVFELKIRSETKGTWFQG